jgi:predicted transcriptional regulator
LSTEKIPNVSIRQLKAARSLLDWSQEILAEKAGLSVPTVKRVETAGKLDDEAGDSVRQKTIDAIRTALEKAGIEFLNHGRPGVRLKARKKL